MNSVKFAATALLLGSTFISMDSHAIGCPALDETNDVRFTLSRTSLESYPMKFDGPKVVLNSTSPTPSHLYFDGEKGLWCATSPKLNQQEESCFRPIDQKKIVMINPDGSERIIDPLKLTLGGQQVGRLEFHGRTARLIPNEPVERYIELSSSDTSSGGHRSLTAKTIVKGLMTSTTSYNFSHNYWLRSGAIAPEDSRHSVSGLKQGKIDFSIPHQRWTGGCGGVDKDTAPQLLPRRGTVPSADGETRQEL